MMKNASVRVAIPLTTTIALALVRTYCEYDNQVKSVNFLHRKCLCTHNGLLSIIVIFVLNRFQ